MVNTKLLRSKMILEEISMEAMAKELNMSTKTLYNRFKSQRFDSSEIVTITKLLNIENRWKFFF